MTPWTAACQAFLSFTISWSLLELMSIESVMPSNQLILYSPLLPLPSIFPTISVFSNESALLIRCPKYWTFSISPSNEYSGLISFRIDWFDFFEFQGTLKSLLQHHSSKISILWCSVFFMVQLSHLYMTTRKTIVLTIWTFLAKYCLCCLGLSWFFFQGANDFNFMAVGTICSDFAAQENEVSHCFAIYLPWNVWTRCHDLSFLFLFLFFVILSFKQAFSLSSFTFTKRFFSFSLLFAIKVVSSAYLRLLIFLTSNLDSSLWFIQPGILHDVLCIC